MSSTNKTANYELSQFVGTDIPSILGDYNGDMRKIDAAIGEVASSAGSSASAVSALAGRVTTVENNVQTLEGAQTVTNQRSVQNQVAITAIQAQIPEEASSENKLVTEAQLDEVSADGKAVDLRLQDVEALIPSSASTSNKLATMADVEGSGSVQIQSVTVSKSGHSTYTSLLNAVKAKINELGLFQHPEKLIAVEEYGYSYYPFGGIDDNGAVMHFTVNRDSVSSSSVTKWVYELSLSTSNSQKFDYLTNISTSGLSNFTINDDSNNTPNGDFKIYYFA